MAGSGDVAGLPAAAATQPLALDHWPAIARRLGGRPLALFLDYDGTLSPIASRPELATLPAAAREVIERLATRLPIAILSGRGLADVATVVGLPQLHYGGSHGFDIAGPALQGGTLRHEVGEDVPAQVEQAARLLTADLAGVEGALVEPKRFSLAVHYRLVHDRDLARLAAAAERAAAATGLRQSGGKKVFELRPAIDWHKGKALLWLLDRWQDDRPGPAGGGPRVPLYIGDDVTDEDAFAVLAERGGLGFLVAEAPRASAADYRLRDPAAVVTLLQRLAELTSQVG